MPLLSSKLKMCGLGCVANYATGSMTGIDTKPSVYEKQTLVNNQKIY